MLSMAGIEDVDDKGPPDDDDVDETPAPAPSLPLLVPLPPPLPFSPNEDDDVLLGCDGGATPPIGVVLRLRWRLIPPLPFFPAAVPFKPGAGGILGVISYALAMRSYVYLSFCLPIVGSFPSRAVRSGALAVRAGAESESQIYEDSIRAESSPQDRGAMAVVSVSRRGGDSSCREFEMDDATVAMLLIGSFPSSLCARARVDHGRWSSMIT